MKLNTKNLKIKIEIDDGECLEIETFSSFENAINYLVENVTIIEDLKKIDNKYFKYKPRKFTKESYSISKKLSSYILEDTLEDLEKQGYVCTYEGEYGYTYEKL